MCFSSGLSGTAWPTASLASWLEVDLTSLSTDLQEIFDPLYESFTATGTIQCKGEWESEREKHLQSVYSSLPTVASDDGPSLCSAGTDAYSQWFKCEVCCSSPPTPTPLFSLTTVDTARSLCSACCDPDWCSLKFSFCLFSPALWSSQLPSLHLPAHHSLFRLWIDLRKAQSCMDKHK